MRSHLMEVKILIQSTPNPNALKFVINMPVKTEGKATYKSVDECQHNPLAAAIFTVANVMEVYFYDNYITVTQDGNVEWDEIEEQIKKIILENAPQHDPSFFVEEKAKSLTPVSSDPDILKIDDILNNTIRPGLQMDGGDIQIVSYDGAVLIVNYQGACGSCPSSTMGTLRAIEGILREQFNPDITVEVAGG